MFTRLELLVGVGASLFASRCAVDLHLLSTASLGDVLDALHTTDLEFGPGLRIMLSW